jgi:hypothetical protein
MKLLNGKRLYTKKQHNHGEAAFGAGRLPYDRDNVMQLFFLCSQHICTYKVLVVIQTIIRISCSAGN